MIKIITSNDSYHNEYVEKAVNKLQKEGFNVKEIKRTEYNILGMFGDDVTHIFYEKGDSK